MTIASAPTATITFAAGTLRSVVSQLSPLLEAAGFPVIEIIEADEELPMDGDTLVVNAAADPDDYSVLMAATTAAATVGFPVEDIYAAEVM